VEFSFMRLFVHAIVLALIVDFILGAGYANAMNIPLFRGVYCTYMTSVTIGGDVSPHGWGAHLLLAGAGAIPLFCFSAARRSLSPLTFWEAFGWTSRRGMWWSDCMSTIRNS
jgi:hypothetical protein